MFPCKTQTSLQLKLRFHLVMVKTKKKSIAKLDNKISALSNQMRKATIAHAPKSASVPTSPKKKRSRARKPASSSSSSLRHNANDCVMHSPSNGEFMTQIAGSVAFDGNSYTVQPGMNTFPWLSTMAINYSRYRFEKLEFVYKPTVSPYVSAGAQGKIILAFNSDVSDSGPSTLGTIENMSPSADGMPYEEVTLRLGPKDLQNLPHYFVRGAIMPPGDPKLFDAGILHVGTSGCFDGSILGELRARYTVRFSNPVSATNLTATFSPLSVAAYTSNDNFVGDGTEHYPNIQLDATNSCPNLFTFAGPYVIIAMAGTYLINVTKYYNNAFGDMTETMLTVRVNDVQKKIVKRKPLPYSSGYGFYEDTLHINVPLVLNKGDKVSVGCTVTSTNAAHTTTGTLDFVLHLVQ